MADIEWPFDLPRNCATFTLRVDPLMASFSTSGQKRTFPGIFTPHRRRSYLIGVVCHIQDVQTHCSLTPADTGPILRKRPSEIEAGAAREGYTPVCPDMDIQWLELTHPLVVIGCLTDREKDQGPADG